MGSRRRARQFALQALYMADLRDVGAMEALNALWSTLLDDDGIEDVRAPRSTEVEFAQRLAVGALEEREAIDALIESSSTNWRLPRMPIVDRNILRMAVYEIMRCEDIPATVSVNEAVELAKLFGTADSRSFVNGIVDRIGRSLGRLQPRRR